MSRAAHERSVTAAWMLSALAVALIIAAVTLSLRGASEEGTILGLKLTARWSYLWFWSAYTVGAWATLLGARVRPYAPRAREFGLAFAAAHLVHLGLVAWLYYVAVHPPSLHTLEFFGVAVFFTYLLAILSFRPMATWLEPRTLTIIRTVGVEYIAFAFFVDFAKDPFDPAFKHVLTYGTFLALGLLGYAVRIAALVRRHWRRLPASPP